MKQSQVAELSTTDLLEKIKAEKADLIKLRMNHAVSPSENPLKIRNTRRVIARMETELRKRERAEMVSSTK
jgi:large subunit ribosomal protein L29